MKVLREHRRTRLSWTPKVSIHISKRREVRTPTVSVRQIIGHEYVVCLNCGYWGKTLRRHITAQRGLSRDQHCQRWGGGVTMLLPPLSTVSSFLRWLKYLGWAERPQRGALGKTPMRNPRRK